MTHHLTLFLTLYYRYALVWKKLWVNFLCLRVIEPTIFMYGLGFGLALAYNEVNGVPYLLYVVPGIMCSSALFSCLFDGTYGTLTRNTYERLWQSQLATNISLRLILFAESTWAAFKAAVGAMLVMLVGWAFGGVENLWVAPLAFLFLWLGGTVIASLGQALCTSMNNYNDGDYIIAFVFTPMFIFSGIFIPLESFPPVIQNLALVLPLTHLVELVRGTFLQTLTLQGVIINLTFLMTLWLITHQIAHTLFKKRLLS